MPQTQDITPAMRSMTDAEKRAWYDNIMDIYHRMRDKAKDGPFEVEFDGLKLTILPNVYDPVGFTDTLYFAGVLKNLVGQGSLLEIGTGSGAIAIECARAGAKVTATDINHDAVECAKLNAGKLGVEVTVLEGDMYQPVGQEKFDFIFWSHPFNNWPTPVDDMLLRSGLDYHYQSMRDYIAGAKDHLTAGGRLLLGTGDSADLGAINKLAAEFGYTMKLLEEKKTTLEDGRDAKIALLLYEFVPKSKP